MARCGESLRVRHTTPATREFACRPAHVDRHRSAHRIQRNGTHPVSRARRPFRIQRALRCNTRPMLEPFAVAARAGRQYMRRFENDFAVRAPRCDNLSVSLELITHRKCHSWFPKR